MDGALPVDGVDAVDRLQGRYPVLRDGAGERAEGRLLARDRQSGLPQGLDHFREPVGVDREDDPDRLGL